MKLEYTVFVASKFQEYGRNETVKVPTGQFETGRFGKKSEVYREEQRWVTTSTSDGVISGDQLNADIAAQLKVINAKGHQVLSITPITSGEYRDKQYGSFHYGFGWSYTSGVLILVRD